ncbi:hypothetical protein [Pseudomonas sp. NBRC 111119]|uniref:hypothetical protein n=1 Tax=Pseudomonas sp. NBRC 111119 TaxID=1661034 RepID=UPI000B222B3E|nr:hypothetical protein [Pseudomonas sp. NBRC 111119]
MTALDELKHLPNVRLILAMPEWDSYLMNIHIASESDLIQLLKTIVTQLALNEIREAKIRALIGCLYLTKHISDLCICLRQTPSGNSLEIDVSVALMLPGEAANSMKFSTEESAHQARMTNSLEGLLPRLESIYAKSHQVGLAHRQTPDFPLALLSATYTSLLSLIQDHY